MVIVRERERVRGEMTTLIWDVRGPGKHGSISDLFICSFFEMTEITFGDRGEGRGVESEKVWYCTVSTVLWCGKSHEAVYYDRWWSVWV